MEVRLESVSKTYLARSGATPALEDINPQVSQGELVCLAARVDAASRPCCKSLPGSSRPRPGASTQASG